MGESAQNHLSLYLYHVSEDPYYRNMPGAGNDPPNVAKAPMGLCLYYILTAHHTSDAVDMDPLTQQRLLGLALKTFHDLPVITDNTTIDGVNPVLPDRAPRTAEFDSDHHATTLPGRRSRFLGGRRSAGDTAIGLLRSQGHFPGAGKVARACQESS